MRLRTKIIIVVLGVIVGIPLILGGTFLFLILNPPFEGKFQAADGIAIDSNDNVYVVDFRSDHVQKFDSNGKYLSKWLSNGHGIGIDTLNHVYIADADNNVIRKSYDNGWPITQWGSNGTKEGQFRHPEDVDIDKDGFVYVADRWNDRIQKFDSNGKFITMWNTSDGEDNIGPFGVAVDNFGNIFVITNYFVKKYSTNIAACDENNIIANDICFVDEWKTSGRGITTDLSGNVYVANSNKIIKYDNDGNFLMQISSFNTTSYRNFAGAIDVTIDAQNNIYVVDSNHFRIVKFDENGDFLTMWGTYRYPPP